MQVCYKSPVVCNTVNKQPIYCAGHFFSHSWEIREFHLNAMIFTFNGHVTFLFRFSPPLFANCKSLNQETHILLLTYRVDLSQFHTKSFNGCIFSHAFNGHLNTLFVPRPHPYCENDKLHSPRLEISSQEFGVFKNI